MSNLRRRTANVLLVTGVIAVGIWAWFNIRGALYQRWANRQFEHRIPSRVPAPGAAQAPHQPPAIADGDLLGRLVVPRLGVHAMVREGDSDGTLDVALGHIPGTALPGQSGNVGIAGHRDTLFRGLGRIHQNDIIEFQSTDKTYQYQVESTQIVTPKTVEVLRPGPQPEITLVTCYPFHYIGPAPERFIVKARLVDPASTSAPAPVAPTPVPVVSAAPKHRPNAPARASFQISEHHSREVGPGVSVGLSWTDPYRQRVTGWVWFSPDRRTIWLRDQKAREPLIFYGHNDGKKRELVFTSVGAHSASGYLKDTMSHSRTSD